MLVGPYDRSTISQDIKHLQDISVNWTEKLLVFYTGPNLYPFKCIWLQFNLVNSLSSWRPYDEMILASTKGTNHEMCSRSAEWQPCRETRHLNHNSSQRERTRNCCVQSILFLQKIPLLYWSGADGSLGGNMGISRTNFSSWSDRHTSLCLILNQHNSCWWIKHQLRLILKLWASRSLTTWTLPT